MVLGNVISNLFPFKITILSLILVYRGTSAKIVKKNLSKKEKVSKQMLTALKILKKYMKYIEKKEQHLDIQILVILKNVY